MFVVLTVLVYIPNSTVSLFIAHHHACVYAYVSRHVCATIFAWRSETFGNDFLIPR